MHDQIGAALRDARRSCGLSLEEVAGRINIRPVYLQAIEAGQFELLPAVPQRLGFTRCYADFLQVDLGDNLQKLSEEVNAHVSQTDYSAPDLLLPETRRGWGIYGVAALVMAVLAGAAFYYSGTPSGDVAQTSVPPAKASLPALEDKAESVAPKAAAPAPADEQGKSSSVTELAHDADAVAPVMVTKHISSVTPAVATPAIATEAHTAPSESLPQEQSVPVVAMDEMAGKPDIEATETETAPVQAAIQKVNMSEPVAVADKSAAEATATYLASGDVYLRARPDNAGAVLGVVSRCEPLQVLGGNKYWRQVEREDGSKGWVFTDYVAPRGQAGCV